MIDPESVACWFHEAYGRLAPDYGYAVTGSFAAPWDQIPESHKDLMMATVSEVLYKMGVRA